jgi:hypothetical protein
LNEQIELLDVVALTIDIRDRNLRRGQVGTIVEVLGQGVFEVEFSDDSGRTYGTAVVKSEEMIVLHHDPVAA